MLALVLLAVQYVIGLILVICVHQVLQGQVLALQVLNVAALEVQVSRHICCNCTIA